VIASVMLSTAAAMEWSAPAGVAVGGMATLVIAIFLFNMPNEDNSRRF
jgi:hypothetical protein